MYCCNGTMRERMCLCMYATDPPEPRLERDIRSAAFSVDPLALRYLKANLDFIVPCSSLVLPFFWRQTTRTTSQTSFFLALPTPIRLRQWLALLLVSRSGLCQALARTGNIAAAGSELARRFCHVVLSAPALRLPGYLFLSVASPAQLSDRRRLATLRACILRSPLPVAVTSSAGSGSVAGLPGSFALWPALGWLVVPIFVLLQPFLLITLSFSPCRTLCPFLRAWCLLRTLLPPPLMPPRRLLMLRPRLRTLWTRALPPVALRWRRLLRLRLPPLVWTRTDDAPMAPVEAETFGSPFLTMQKERTQAAKSAPPRYRHLFGQSGPGHPDRLSRASDDRLDSPLRRLPLRQSSQASQLV